jgi:hypothetical protein
MERAPPGSLGHVNAVQPRQTDVEQHEIRLQGLRLSDGLEAIRGFRDDPIVRALLEQQSHELTKWLMVIDQQNRRYWHRRPNVNDCKGKPGVNPPGEPCGRRGLYARRAERQHL